MHKNDARAGFSLNLALFRKNVCASNIFFYMNTVTVTVSIVTATLEFEHYWRQPGSQIKWLSSSFYYLNDFPQRFQKSVLPSCGGPLFVGSLFGRTCCTA